MFVDKGGQGSVILFEKFRGKLTEKWSEKASVVWTLEILSLLDLVKTWPRVCP